MNAAVPDSGREFYGVREAAWLLGVPESVVSRGVRVGSIPAVSRRGRLVVPGHVVRRLLGEPVGGDRP
ncbi:hypothetical protein BLA60_14865 [Actinophytocola xinjiangensis]|uniref:Helix-turn-helix domain-containing protein n=1 Tax=Actinophytocola xinjiangensis TaxID=485602 RepID=A0A7Z0WME3_9PSEU|nr:hypothetical protein BLA60_14865 [Actinophytocola xinjiangensis]